MCPSDGEVVVQDGSDGTDETVSISSETLEGYVIDVACVRKYARSDLTARSRAHTRACVLMGHCIESGYALVSEDGHLILLDEHATPLVVESVRNSERDRGIRLRVERTSSNGEMHTVSVREMTDEH